MNYLADNLMLSLENPSTDELIPQMWCEQIYSFQAKTQTKRKQQSAPSFFFNFS